MTRIALALLLVAAPLGAQARAIAWTPPTSASVAGTYRLHLVNGQRLPAGDHEEVDARNTMRIVVDSGRARLGRDGRFTATVTYRFWWQALGEANEWIPAVTRSIDGRWALVRETGEVAFYPARKPGRPPKPFYGQLDGNRITMAVRYKGGAVKARDVVAVVRKVGP